MYIIFSKQPRSPAYLIPLFLLSQINTNYIVRSLHVVFSTRWGIQAKNIPKVFKYDLRQIGKRVLSYDRTYTQTEINTLFFINS